jgi:hypothetical protein
LLAKCWLAKQTAKTVAIEAGGLAVGVAGHSLTSRSHSDIGIDVRRPHQPSFRGEAAGSRDARIAASKPESGSRVITSGFRVREGRGPQ